MLLRVNIRKIKALIWLASAGVFVFAGWTFYDIFTLKQQKHYEHRSRDYFITDVLKANVHEQVGSSKKPFYDKDKYEKVWDTQIDGTLRPPPKGPEESVPVVKEEDKPVPPIDSIVDIGLVLWAPQPELRFVALSYKAGAGAPAATPAAGASATVTKESRLHLSEGDPLKPPYDTAPYNGKVLHIDEQEVTFQWGKGEATVTPGLGVTGGDLPLRLFTVPEQQDLVADIPAPQKTTLVTPGNWLMGTDDLEHIRKEPQAFMDQNLHVRTVTPASGGHSSLEITEDPAPDSLAAQFGAKKGDKLISVNGIPMSSLSGAMNWFKQNSGLPEYVVVYEPAGTGKQETIVVHVK
jgi:hypothetical protein